MKECKHPTWYLIGTNELGTWWNCSECKTTGLNKDKQLKTECTKSQKKGKKI